MSDRELPCVNIETLVQGFDIRKSFHLGNRSIEVLKGLDISIAKGEFLSLMGSSGAGKSTLLHLIGGLDRPDHGRILFDGTDLARFNASRMAAFRRVKVGFIFQSFNLFPELNALENVCLPARLARRNVKDTQVKATELLERVGLSKRLDHRPYELSGGEQQRVSIARALINGPDLILADEPTGNLDSKNGLEIMEILMRMRTEHQTTLVIATHDPQIASHAPKTLELKDGLMAINPIESTDHLS